VAVLPVFPAGFIHATPVTAAATDAITGTTWTGTRHFINAARFSCRGLAMAYRNESAFRQELVLLLASLPLAAWLAAGPVQWVLLVGVVLLVMIVELLNSGLEACVDRIGVEHHNLSGLAKDLGSAAVMLALVLAGLVWASVLAERFWPLW
jgi:diacylglycerol kinase (ATP)